MSTEIFNTNSPTGSRELASQQLDQCQVPSLSDLGRSEHPQNPSYKPWQRSSPYIYSMQSILQRGKTLLTPRGSSRSLGNKTGFTTVKEATELFPNVDPAVDGEDCLHDCASCSVDLPRKWSIDESDKLFGHVNGWESHLVVATGKTDWVRDVKDEKGSLMEKVGQVANSGKQMEYNGRQIMLSASDMPTGTGDHGTEYSHNGRTRCLVLPGWKYVDGVSTEEVEWMMMQVVSKGSSNLSPMNKQESAANTSDKDEVTNSTGDKMAAPDTNRCDGLAMPDAELGESGLLSSIPIPIPPGVQIRACPHRAIILMCSHKTRDWRCGASAPLLRKEFERHLRPLGMYRDLHDDRPGGVGIYFINHVGGHKYSANVMIYRRAGWKADGQQIVGNGSTEEVLSDEAIQGIWLARVRPEDCENIVKYTVLQGKLVKPQRQLRGGFDRERGLTSW